MRIGVDMLFYLESLAFHLHLDANVNVKSLSIRSKGRVIRILHITAGKLQVTVLNPFFHKFRIKVFHLEELSGTVHHRPPYSFLVFESERSYVVLLAHTVIIRSERRSYMHDTRTFLRRDKVSADYPHRVLFRKDPRQELAVSYTLQVFALEAVQNLVRHQLVSRFVIAERNAGGLRVEIAAEQLLGNDVNSWLAGIRVEGRHPHIFDVRAYAKSYVGRQGPRSCGPSYEEKFTL